MGKKKKLKSKAGAADMDEAIDEMVALQSIFAEEYRPDNAGTGFSLFVVPHPGQAAANHVSLDLDIRYIALPPSQSLWQWPHLSHLCAQVQVRLSKHGVGVASAQ